MRITFVYPDLASDDPHYTGYFHHGIAVLSAILKKAGHQTNLIQFTKEISNNEFQEKIKTLKPDLIGFSCTSHVFSFVQKYAQAAKEVSQALIVCGGVHPTVCPEEVIKDKNIDIVCRGEGDLALLELCQKMEKGKSIEKIENLWVKKGEKVFKNKLRPVVSDFDSLPFPDREIFNYTNLNLEKTGVGTFIFSRGCPYQCTFCCESTLRNLYPDPENYHRSRSPRLVIKEIKEIRKKYPFINFIRLDDDLLFTRIDWLKEFVPLYQNEVALPFSADIRVNLMTEERLSLLKQAGCHLLRVGVESGDDFILKEILKKGITVLGIKKAFEAAKKRGIKVQAYNMMGVPYEGSQEILKTIKLNAQIKADLSVVSIFYPYKGTYLHELCRQKEFLSEQESQKIPKNYYSHSVLSLPTIRKEQINFFFRYFYLLKRFYGFLFKIPFCKFFIFIADKFFSFKYVPELAIITLDPVKSVMRRVLAKKDKQSQRKKDTEVRPE